jgi:hypothetical protein
MIDLWRTTLWTRYGMTYYMKPLTDVEVISVLSELRMNLKFPYIIETNQSEQYDGQK